MGLPPAAETATPGEALESDFGKEWTMAVHRMKRPWGTWLLATGLALTWPASGVAQAPPPSADLGIELFASGFQFTAGELVSLNGRVQNHGPDPATNVVVDLELPAGTAFESASSAPANVLSCTTPAVGAGGAVRCTRPSVTPNQLVILRVTIRTSTSMAGTFFDTTARLSSSTPDPVSANNASTSTVLVLGPDSRSDLSVRVTAFPSPVLPRATLVHEIIVTNHGPDPTTSAELGLRSNGLPLEIEDFDLPSGWQCNYVPVGIPPPDFEPVICNEYFVPVGSFRFRLAAQVPGTQSVPVFLNLRLTSAANDPDLSNNETSISTPLGSGSGVPVPASRPALLTLLVLIAMLSGLLALQLGGTGRR